MSPWNRVRRSQVVDILSCLVFSNPRHCIWGRRGGISPEFQIIFSCVRSIKRWHSWRFECRMIRSVNLRRFAELTPNLLIRDFRPSATWDFSPLASLVWKEILRFGKVCPDTSLFAGSRSLLPRLPVKTFAVSCKSRTCRESRFAVSLRESCSEMFFVFNSRISSNCSDVVQTTMDFENMPDSFISRSSHNVTVSSDSNMMSFWLCLEASSRCFCISIFFWLMLILCLRVSTDTILDFTIDVIHIPFSHKRNFGLKTRKLILWSALEVIEQSSWRVFMSSDFFPSFQNMELSLSIICLLSLNSELLHPDSVELVLFVSWLAHTCVLFGRSVVFHDVQLTLRSELQILTLQHENFFAHLSAASTVTRVGFAAHEELRDLSACNDVESFWRVAFRLNSILLLERIYVRDLVVAIDLSVLHQMIQYLESSLRQLVSLNKLMKMILRSFQNRPALTYVSKFLVGLMTCRRSSFGKMAKHAS